METGKNYAELINTDEYYLGRGDDKIFMKIELAKKFLMKTIIRKPVKAYFSLHADEEIKDLFLKGLIDFVDH